MTHELIHVTADPEGNVTVTLTEYLRLVGRHWLAIVIVFLLCAGSGSAYAFTTAPQYTATAKFYVLTTSLTDAGSLNQAAVYSETVAANLAVAASTPAVLESVGRSLSPAKSAPKLVTLVHAAVEPATSVVDITVTLPSASQAESAANQVVAQLSALLDDLTVQQKSGAPVVTLVTLQSANAPTPDRLQTLLIVGVSAVVGIVLALVVAMTLDLYVDSRNRRVARRVERERLEELVST